MSAEIIQLRPARTLLHVLADLLIAEGELDRLRAIPPHETLTDAQDKRWSELENIIDAAKQEGRDMVLRATGASWDALAVGLA